MALGIFEPSTDFTLSTPMLGLGSVNNSATYTIRTDPDSDKPVLLAFIEENANPGDWLELLRSVHDDGDTDCTCVAVFYSYSGSAYSAPSVDVPNLIQNHFSAELGRTLENADFDDIPILLDQSDAGPGTLLVSEHYRDTGIFGDSSYAGFNATDLSDGSTDLETVPRDCAFYILQPHGWVDTGTDGHHRITDKWHTESLSKIDYPLSLRYLLNRDPDSTVNQTGTSLLVRPYVVERLKNLSASLSVLRTFPAHQQNVSSLSEVSFVYSKPEDRLPLMDWSGSGLVQADSSPSVITDPVQVPTIVKDTYENRIRMDNSDVELKDDSGTEDKVTLDLFDPDDTVTPPTIQIGSAEWTVDVDNPTVIWSGPSVTKDSPFKVTAVFSGVIDNITDQAVIDGFCTSSNITGISNSTSLSPGQTTTDEIEFTITPQAVPADDLDGIAISLQIPANVTSNAAGGGNAASSTFTVIFDDVSPDPVLDTDPAGEDTVSGDFDIVIDFGEAVAIPSDYSSWFIDSGANQCMVEDVEEDPDYTQGGFCKVFTAIARVPSNPGGNLTVNLRSGASSDAAGNASEAATLSVAYADPPNDLRRMAVVVDVSGSMGTEVSIDGGPDRPKLEYVKEALDGFLGEIQVSVSGTDGLSPTDEIRFYKYSNQAEAISLGGGGWIQLVNLTDDLIDDLLDDLVVDDMTAMGDGLVLALGDLDYGNDPNDIYRHVILFADGQNNMGSDISTSDVGQPVTIQSSPGITINYSNGWDIPIHSIGIQTPGQSDNHWLTTMECLSAASAAGDDAIYFALDDVWPGLNAALVTVVDKIYAANTPQEVFGTVDKLLPGVKEKSYQVPLDSTLKSVMVLVSWPGDTPLDVSFRRGRISLPTRRLRRGRRNLIRAFTIPKTPKPRLGNLISRLPGPILDSAGSLTEAFLSFGSSGPWQLKVERSSGAGEVPFYVSVIGEARGFSLSLRLPDIATVAGKPIPAKFIAAINGSTVVSRMSGEAVVCHRSNPAPDVLSRYLSNLPALSLPPFDIRKTGAKPLLPSSPKESMPVQQRRGQLFDLKKAREGLLQQTRYVVKQEPVARGGTVSWNLRSTAVPGIYRIRFNLRGTDRNIGSWSRSMVRTVVVHSRIDVLASDIRTEQDGNRLKVWFMPRSSDGYCLGPGFAETLILECDYFKAGRVTDNLDNTYFVEFELKRPPTSPIPISVRMAGQIIVRGTIGNRS